LSIALGLSAIETGVRILPLSITLILAAAGIPKFFPSASPRRVVQLGFLALLAGLLVMVGALDAGAGAEIVTWPMLPAGRGVGVPPEAADAIVEENATARLTGLRSALSVLAIVALVAVLFSRRIPTEQPASTKAI